MACPASVQERLRGWQHGSFPLGRRPYADSRVQLTGGRKVYNNRRGGVLSPRTPTASRMVVQCSGWRRGGGDGRIGPTVTDESRLPGPASRRRPGRACNRRSLFECFADLFRGCSAWAILEWVAQCHGADTSLTAQCPTVAGMASPGGLAEQHRDMTPRRVRGVARIRL
jgi:hypothetical protein